MSYSMQKKPQAKETPTRLKNAAEESVPLNNFTTMKL